MIEQLCIIGVGLIGGSIARAARARGLCRRIVGVDSDPVNLRKALALGILDAGGETIAATVPGSDWVVIATPVGAFEAVLHALKPFWSAATLYTDAGSTKQSVVDAASRVFGEVPGNFVPGHPIAGAEASGAEASCANLYVGRRVILTPVPSTTAEALGRVEAFWQALGAQVSRMAPLKHDEVLAATSHLPHVLAYALVHLLGRKDAQEEIFPYAAGGFRDFTRIASSDPQMWRDICLANGARIIPLMEQLREELGELAALIEAGAAADLLAYFAEAREARQRFLNHWEKHA